MKKVPHRRKKVVWQKHFVLSWPHGILSINKKPQNLWFKLCSSILITKNILCLEMATIYRYIGNIDILRLIYRYRGIWYIGLYRYIYQYISVVTFACYLLIRISWKKVIRVSQSFSYILKKKKSKIFISALSISRRIFFDLQ